MPRTATPTAIKKLAGNPGKRALNKAEPQPSGVPSRPTTMTSAARKVWTRLIGAMPADVYTACDSALLAAYCEAVAAHQTATRLISDKNFEPIGTGSTGQQVIHPAYKLQADQARLIATLGQRLGLDPIARQSINSAPQGTEEDSFKGLMN
ncbi:P27 family predicted phage terminase small subunit [Novosphingobium chloroacetimidivorans]|uniref:P27 family predicted phage terminase small subunit n=1 Tax=Novosphingobium chloroacetimidivorans TaxID=1428314 RepID=A0A7W7KBJ4_9SPHN|nr:phage terminase small subunit P27 family [Novosphingobium chloroacetimidivorans]MBB4859456.1 P27 family predicted phage terminase small subunit [Novosphingobium chloroacetimidivorans]